MLFKEVTSFGIIKRNKPIPKFYINYSESSYKINKTIFGKVPKESISMVIVDNWSDWEKETKPYKSPTSLAMAFPGKIVLKSADFLTEEHKRKHKGNNKYHKVLDKWAMKNITLGLPHEMNHCFWFSIYDSMKPLWMSEAYASKASITYNPKKKELAEYVKKKKITSKILTHKFYHKEFTDNLDVLLRYNLWLNFLNFLTMGKKNSLDKFMNDYKRHKTKGNYYLLFKKHFGNTEGNLFNEFIKRYN